MQIRRTKQIEVPQITKAQYILPRRVVDRVDSFLLKSHHDQSNRLYTFRDLENFKIMKCEVEIDNLGIRINHPSSFLCETELVYKINSKHDNSVYNSESQYHERSEDNLFPLNKVQNYRLIDATSVISSSKIKQDLISYDGFYSTSYKPKPVSMDFNASNPNRKPPLKMFNTNSVQEKPPKQSKFNSCEKMLNILPGKESNSSVDKSKKDLVLFLEKSTNIGVETTKPNRLNYFYKKVNNTASYNLQIAITESGVNSSNCISNLRCMKLSKHKPCNGNLKLNLLGSLQSPPHSFKNISSYLETSNSKADQVYSVNPIPTKY